MIKNQKTQKAKTRKISFTMVSRQPKVSAYIGG